MVNEERLPVTNNSVAIMQPYLFPYIGYFQLLGAVDEFIFYDDVQYIRRGWVNRNRILNGNDDQMITLPVTKCHVDTTIANCHYRNSQEDKRKFLETVRHCYCKAPYFDVTFELVRAILGNRETSVGRFNGNCIAAVARFLSLETRFLYSSELEVPAGLAREDRLAAIAESRGASCYINAIGGLSLYHGKPFAARDIVLRFLKPIVREYGQSGVHKAGGLSIIDVLMYNTAVEVQGMLSEYELVPPCAQ